MCSWTWATPNIPISTLAWKNKIFLYHQRHFGDGIEFPIYYTLNHHFSTSQPHVSELINNLGPNGKEKEGGSNFKILKMRVTWAS